MTIDGMYVLDPAVHRDDRGTFLEWFNGARLAEATGHVLNVAQLNFCTSRRGVVRGIHFADVPPGQAKLVTCLRGAILDVVVDVRVGSPTFGQCSAVRLDDLDHRGVYLAEGLGHVLMALTDDARVTYACSQPYAPTRERAVNPLDPALAIPWPPDIPPILSPKDAAAPTLAQALEAGILPTYHACLTHYAA